MILNLLFTVLAPLLLLQGIILENEVYGNVLSVPNAAEFLEHYDLDIELSRETAIIINKLELKTTENQEYIEIYIPHIAFNNGRKEGKFRNNDFTHYRGNETEQFNLSINGCELNSGYSFTVHDSLIQLQSKFLELENTQKTYLTTIPKIHSDHEVKVDSNNIATYLSTAAMKNVHNALDSLKIWKTNYEFHHGKTDLEFDNKVLSGTYPWYVLKIKNDFDNVETISFELSYELELGPSVNNKEKNYFHFMFNNSKRNMETPVNVSLNIKNLPFRKIKSQLPEEFIYDTENKIVSGLIDPKKIGKLLLFFR